MNSPILSSLSPHLYKFYRVYHTLITSVLYSQWDCHFLSSIHFHYLSGLQKKPKWSASCLIHHQFFLQNAAKGQSKNQTLKAQMTPLPLTDKIKIFGLTTQGSPWPGFSIISCHSPSLALPKMLPGVWHYLPLWKLFHLSALNTYPSYLCLVLKPECASDSPKELGEKKKKAKQMVRYHW